MADNLTVTPGAGASLRAIEISGQLYQAAALTAFDDDGWTVYRKISAASDNSTSIATTNGILHAVVAFNINATVRYLKIYDKASAPTVGTDTPAWTIPLTGGATGPLVPIPVLDWEFALGLGIGIVTGIGDSSTTATAANEQVVHLLYKAQ